MELTADKLPAAPWWFVLSGASAGIGWSVWSLRRAGSMAQAVVGSVGVLAMLSGSLILVPHNLLFAMIWLVQLINPGRNVFGVTPGAGIALPLAGHLLAVAAAATLAYTTIRVWRQARGRCHDCGRSQAEPTSIRTQWMVAFGALSILGCLPYGALKLAWSFGWQGGMTDSQFDGVGFSSPGFGDTVILTGISIIVSAGMMARLTTRWLRPLLAFVGAVGSVMLLPIGAIGAARAALEIVGLMPITYGELAPWVFHMVYLGFVTWGVGLCGLTIAYVRATASPCRRHVASGAPLTSGTGRIR